MANVLVLSYLPLYPTNGGGRVRIYQIASRLAERHDVSVLCPRIGASSKNFEFTVYDWGVPGWRQLVAPRTFRNALQVAQETHPDVVLLEYVWQGMHALTLRLLCGVPVILDAFDVVTLRFKRTGRKIWPLVSLYERTVLRGVDRVLAVSDFDRCELVRLGARATSTDVVPNGVDTAVFRPDNDAGLATRAALGIGCGERLLFFFGQLDYAPNADAVVALAEHVMPRLSGGFQLAIAGRGASEELRRRCQSERIRFLGALDPLPAYINAADAVVAPIRSGSGTRLKILESLACGVPTVTTTLGAEGIDRTACGPALRIADGWDTFAAEIVRASESARPAPPPSFIDTYDWGAIVGRMTLL